MTYWSIKKWQSMARGRGVEKEGERGEKGKEVGDEEDGSMTACVLIYSHQDWDSFELKLVNKPVSVPDSGQQTNHASWPD